MTVPPLWSCGGGGGGGGAGSGGTGRDVRGDEVETCSAEEARHRRQARLLATRCRLLAQHNQRLVHRIYQVKKLTKQYKKEIKFLIARLDMHGDEFRTVKTEEDVKPNISPLQYSSGHNVKVEKNSSSRPVPNDKSSIKKAPPKKKSARPDRNGVTTKKLNNTLFQFNQEHRPLVIAESSSDLSFGEPSKQDKTRPSMSKWRTLSCEDKKIKK